MRANDRWSAGAEPAPAADPNAEVAAHAATLRTLHRPGDPLLLPNAWDPDSARLVAAAGLPAVATSSAAVAESLGYADGEAMPVAEMLDAVARIVEAVDVPVTADLERGYGLAPDELVERLAAAGAAGCNLEDSDPRTAELLDPHRQASFLAEVRDAACRSGTNLVINARIDTFICRAEPPRGRLAETLRRGRLYHAAGADCLYPILLDDPHEIAQFVDAVQAPVNILARLASSGRLQPTMEVLRELGVARVSLGPYLYRSSRSHTANLIAELLRP